MMKSRGVIKNPCPENIKNISNIKTLIPMLLCGKGCKDIIITHTVNGNEHILSMIPSFFLTKKNGKVMMSASDFLGF